VVAFTWLGFKGQIGITAYDRAAPWILVFRIPIVGFCNRITGYKDCC